MSAPIVLLALDDSATRPLVERALRAAGYEVALAGNSLAVDKLLTEVNPLLMMVGESVGGYPGIKIAAQVLERFPTLPIILFAEKDNPDLYRQALRAGLRDVIVPPLRIDDVVEAIKQSEQRSAQLGDWVRREVRSSTSSLEKRINEMQELVELGRTVTGTLDLDTVLTSVVTAAVRLSNAEEGQILLLDRETGDLYMRASLNFDENFARTFRLPVKDTLAGQVLHTGQPVVFSADSPTKIKTAYLVHALIYVPLRLRDQVIGVLGVDNRHNTQSFAAHLPSLLSILADYAAISIENARLYAKSESERIKMDTTLTNIGDGVIVIDNNMQLLLINPVARRAFGLGNAPVAGQDVRTLIDHDDFISLLNGAQSNLVAHHEISFEDGRVFNALFTPIPDVGSAITLQEISHLKMLDRLKSDFIHTVSHDLRSPLTAILGYVELMGRVGPLNEQQQEFVRRVQVSVNSITALVNDLLDLGRIEAGFDTLKENVDLAHILNYSLENLHAQVTEKKLQVTVNIAPNLLYLRGNPLRLRQMFDNLLGNAVKYTRQGGNVEANLRCEASQIIFEVKDNGVGIPPADQPHIFEKFYRASNAAVNSPGTGLGLAIVKSIVDNHNGRIWVQSVVGEGSQFVVVLPASDVEMAPDAKQSAAQ